MIKERYQKIKEQIKRAQAGSRFAQDVALIVVSKTHPVCDLMEAYEAGARSFGENKFRTGKMPRCRDVRWHLVDICSETGEIYCRKNRLIHSVDSPDSPKIDIESRKAGVISDILIQVNISQEETKFGIDQDEVISLIGLIQPLRMSV